MTKLAFVDCETTGLEPDRHEIYEVGLILRDHDQADRDQEYRWWLEVDLAKADPNALKVGRYFDRQPMLHLTCAWEPDRDTGLIGLKKRAVGHLEVADSVMRYTAGAHLVGAVPSFDAAFLSRLLRANGCCPAWHYHLVDVEALAAGHLAGQRWLAEKMGVSAEDRSDGAVWARTATKAAEIAPPPWDSTDLSRAVGVEPQDFERHTALGDARWARAIYDKVVGDGQAS